MVSSPNRNVFSGCCNLDVNNNPAESEDLSNEAESNSWVPERRLAACLLQYFGWRSLGDSQIIISILRLVSELSYQRTARLHVRQQPLVKLNQTLNVRQLHKPPPCFQEILRQRVAADVQLNQQITGECSAVTVWVEEEKPTVIWSHSELRGRKKCLKRWEERSGEWSQLQFGFISSLLQNQQNGKSSENQQTSLKSFMLHLNCLVSENWSQNAKWWE